MGLFGKKKQSPIVKPTNENIASHAEFTAAMMKNVNRGYALADPGPEYSLERAHAALDALTWYALENEDEQLLLTLTRISHTYTIGNPHDPTSSPEFWGEFLFESTVGVADQRKILSAAGNPQLADDLTAFSTPAIEILKQLPEYGAVMDTLMSHAEKLTNENNP